MLDSFSLKGCHLIGWTRNCTPSHPSARASPRLVGESQYSDLPFLYKRSSSKFQALGETSTVTIPSASPYLPPFMKDFPELPSPSPSPSPWGRRAFTNMTDRVRTQNSGMYL